MGVFVFLTSRSCLWICMAFNAGAVNKKTDCITAKKEGNLLKKEMTSMILIGVFIIVSLSNFTKDLSIIGLFLNTVGLVIFAFLETALLKNLLTKYQQNS